MDHQKQFSPVPHVVIFPLPLQGPVNCMLKLAELFCLYDLTVTFINTDHIQGRLRSCSDVESRFEKYSNFRFQTIPDGLPEDNPRTGDEIVKLLEFMEVVSKPIFRELVTSGPLGHTSEKPVTCIVGDGIFSFAVDIAKEIGVPLVYFDTISPCGLWTYICLPKLIEAKEFPFQGDDLDAPVTSVQEMECRMRRRDLPSFYRVCKIDDPLIQMVLNEDQHLPLAQALIFNTFDDLDRGTISLMRTLGPKVYAIGPLHTHLKTRLAATNAQPASSQSLWKEDKSCIDWLDMQPNRSVIYVSIGSLATMTMCKQMEIWHGLVNSGTRFLWVQRPGSIVGLEKGIEIPEELAKATEERGCIVSWAPQEEVLAHRGIGGFLTHNGWNSTLESVVEGVPMIGWPYFVDQQVNSRYLSEVWKLGLDMKDTCDRVIIEKMVRDLMELKRGEFLQRADEMAKLAKLSVSEGPVNCMLKLAELFCFYDLQVTFLNTDYIQHRLLKYTDISGRFKQYSKRFRFETVPDGLPEDSPRTGEQLGELLDAMEAVSLPLFREIVRSGVVTCIIADGAFSFAVEVGGEFGVPVMYFDTISPCGLWSFLCANKLIESGDFPFKDNDLDAPVTSVPGMEGFLRRRDLPNFFRTSSQNDPIIQRVLKEEQQMRQSHGLIFNSFEDLEGPILSQLKTITSNVYAIGPLHTHKMTRLTAASNNNSSSNSANSIWKENKDCISWLDKQPAKSVIYVSIGSLALMAKEQFLEIWHGLANSGVRFLWVQRPGSIKALDDKTRIPKELYQATIERGCIVNWAPQEEVLAHHAIGGFLTHSGWNSTLESIVEGVPMICWPYFADQQVNSRYVGDVWKFGLDMKDTCDREIVEKMVRDVMEERKNEFLQNVDCMAKLAKASVSEGGSSYNALNRLIDDIKLMSMETS
ncbi:hypothetical protein ACH5RR_016752 [Cinchona calisaya]|uniref:Uncharacterized protein n=1 Tax=Cinchona calisaya TaxID=153742 RepID=A0ABD2ZX87_9GENT